MADPTIRRGSRGAAVTKAQRALASAGFDPGNIDGIFGPRTEAAVRAFQTARSLALIDGIVGPETWGALPKSVVRLHVKIVVAPTPSVDQIIASMRTVYASARVGVELVSIEILTATPALENIDVGSCPFPCPTTPTASQAGLFANRNNVGANEIAIYFVRTLMSGGQQLGGCCAHAPGNPASIVASATTLWAVAHEVGHVLGLAHCDSQSGASACSCLTAGRLMTSCFLNFVTPPTIDATEAATMDASPLTIDL